VQAPRPRGEDDGFYADSDGFAELQLNDALVDALQRAGFKRPAAVQVRPTLPLASAALPSSGSSVLRPPPPPHPEPGCQPGGAALQALAAPYMLSKQNVVLAAETGSGKTLAYIAPLASLLLDAAADLDPDTRGCAAPALQPPPARPAALLGPRRPLAQRRPTAAAATAPPPPPDPLSPPAGPPR
jgi:hypothetical protein